MQVIVLVIVGILCVTTGLSAAPRGILDRNALTHPGGAPPSQLAVALGKTLFFDNRLSKDNRVSCATCHVPELGWSDGMTKSICATGRPCGRHTPHIVNVGFQQVIMNGKFPSLEVQTIGTMEGGAMGLPRATAVAKLKQVPWYVEMFRKIYHAEITPQLIGRAVAAFQRSIISDNAAYDRYVRGDKTALLPAQIRGMQLFQGKAQCIVCHHGPNFTDERFHTIGLRSPDPGRGKLRHRASIDGGWQDRFDTAFMGAFATPGLRNVALHPPYMHDGSLKTLEEVVRFYKRGGDVKTHLDPLMTPLTLSERDIADLVAFLGALTASVLVERPTLP